MSTFSFTEISNAALNPFIHIWNNIVEYLPGLIGAIIISLIGYYVGLFLGNISKKLLMKWKLDNWVNKNNFSKTLLNIRLSELISNLVKWSIFIAFLAPAASLIKLNMLANMLETFAMWLPNLLFAIIIMIIGLMLSKILANLIPHSNDHKVAKVVSQIVQIAVIIVFVDVALNLIGLHVVFAETIILLIIGAILISAAIAVGIGFGSAIKDNAKTIVGNISAKRATSKPKAKKRK